MARPGYEADRYRIVLRSWPDGKDRILTEAWDRSPQGLAWSSDGKTIYAVAENLGQASLFAVDAAAGTVRTVVEKGNLASPQPAGGRILYLSDDLKSPVEIFSVNPDGSDVRAVTKMNAAKVAAARMGEYEQFSFKGANSETVYGYVMKPADFDPAKKYPVALLIHGGPQGSFGNHFHYRWNPQAYAGAGYASVMIDFHGSTGYGQAFTDSIGGDWGGKPLVDLQKGLAAALSRYSWMDGDRVCALGASYGAYMINWIQGNWPDRFRCLVSHDGNLDERAAYYDTEELWFPEWDHKGLPWENPAGVREAQPGQLREELEDAHAGGARREGLPDRGQPGDLDLHGAAAEGDSQQVPLLPRREPLGAEAREQHPLARHGPGLAGPVDEGEEVGGPPQAPAALPGPAPRRGPRARPCRSPRTSGRSAARCRRGERSARTRCGPPRRE